MNQKMVENLCPRENLTGVSLYSKLNENNYVIVLYVIYYSQGRKLGCTYIYINDMLY
jgi:hypothetical protein